MEGQNCDLPAPSFYKHAMHNFHIISFPIYILALNALFRETSTAFVRYKFFLIAHIFINIISESYVSFLMLPMTYLPHPMFRNTGWLAEFGFSGMFIFYGLAQSVMLTVGSILEMFYFRFKLIDVYKNNLFKKLLRFQVLLYHFLIIFHFLFAGVTINYSIGIEKTAVEKLFQENPDLPPEVTCYSCIIAVFDDVVMYIISGIYCIQVILQFTVSSSVFMFVLKFVKTGQGGMSSSTMKLQRMMVLSLFIQGGIHGMMIMVPTMFLIYALFFQSTLNELALTFLMCVAYHGFASTCAMIVFTKPLRQRIVPCLKGEVRTEPSDPSRLRSTSTPNRSSHQERSNHSQHSHRSSNVAPV